MITEADFAGGTVTLWDFNADFSLPLAAQINELKEDLIQVEYPDQDLIIDVGWYPEFSAEGSFVVQLIGNQEWDSPLMKLDAPDFDSLHACIESCVETVTQSALKSGQIHR